MRLLCALALLCFSPLPAGAKAPDAAQPALLLPVRIYDHTTISAPVLRKARNVACTIYLSAGIELHWLASLDDARRHPAAST
jgi:hypothetical protein